MILNISFKSASGYEYETMRTEFDRNYRDEDQALVFVQSEEDNFNGYYEVNIRKERGKPTEQGYVAVYQSEDDAEPSELINDVQISVTLHDFDNVLEVANAELMQDGLQIVLEYDGECYWEIGTQIKATKEIKWYVSADFENEVRGHIYECWAHARALADSLKEGKADDKPKVYVFGVYQIVDGEEIRHDEKVYADDKKAKRELALFVEDEMKYVKERGWQIGEYNEAPTDNYFLAFKDGYYATNHTEAYVRECEVL